MAKILMICPLKSDPTAFYRSSGVVRDLEKKTDYDIVVIDWNQVAVDWQVISNYDVIFLQRPFTKVAADLCLYAKGMNKPLWVDYDDFLFGLNPENPAYMTYIKPDVQENIKVCLKNADVISVPTEYLKQAYLQFNKNIEVIPNAFNDGIFKRGELKKREKTALWRGPAAHIYDLMSHGNEINKICEGFPEWNFSFMGYYPWFLTETQNKECIEGMEIISYFNKIVDLAPSIVHVPLHDNPFNRCRSNIAAIEGTFAGAAIVCPEWWNFPGALSYSNPAEYYEAMRSLLSGEVDCELQNKISWEFIQDCLTLSKINVQRIELLNSIL